MILNYFRFGTGARPFLILPGLSLGDIFAASEAIAAAFADFADTFTVYLMDRREVIPEGFSIADMAEDIADTLQSLGLTRVSVFGASQGGMIAQALALAHPTLVDRLVLGSTLARSNETASAVIDRWAALAEAGDAKGLMECFIDLVYSVPVPVRGWEAITQSQLDRFAGLARACLGFDVYDRLPELTCPTLVLGSLHDRVLTGQAVEELADRLGCERHLYEDYGHAVYDEAPDFRPRMLEFLKK